MKNILKRFLLFAALIAILCTMTSCNGKSEEAQKVDDMISALDSINLDSELAIAEAEVAFASLSDKDKKAVEGRKQLEDARNDFDTLKANAVHDAIQQVVFWRTDLDNSIPKILYARKIFDDLNEHQKALVDNYDDLVKAEDGVIQLKVKPVEELIERLSEFDFEDEAIAFFSEEASDAVNMAQKEFDNLPIEYQDKVSNVEKLKKALECRTVTRVSKMISLIDEYCQEIDLDSMIPLVSIEMAYEVLTDEEKAQVTNYNVFQNAQEAYNKLQPIQLNSYRTVKESSNEVQFYLNATNTSSKIIKEFSIRVFAFDSDGVPVRISSSFLSDSYSAGCRYSAAVKPGERTKSSSYWRLHGIYSDMKQIVVIVDSVEFFDETTWHNFKYEELLEKYNQQLLKAGDTNIIPKS